jgi:hypothetical protein
MTNEGGKHRSEAWLDFERSSVLVPTEEAKFTSDPGEIGKGQLHVKCLHESGDDDQHHPPYRYRVAKPRQNRR